MSINFFDKGDGVSGALVGELSCFELIFLELELMLLELFLEVSLCNRFQELDRPGRLVP